MRESSLQPAKGIPNPGGPGHTAAAAPGYCPDPEPARIDPRRRLQLLRPPAPGRGFQPTGGRAGCTVAGGIRRAPAGLL